VRALFFLSAIHRYHLPTRSEFRRTGRVPYDGFSRMLERRFEEAISGFLRAQDEQGANENTVERARAAYHELGFQTLADQVRHTVRATRGNAWMFRLGHPLDQPLRVRPELLRAGASDTPIPSFASAPRCDGPDPTAAGATSSSRDGLPEGARVLNVSIDLSVHGRDSGPRPPVEAYFRVIDEPVHPAGERGSRGDREVRGLDELFDFAATTSGSLRLDHRRGTRASGHRALRREPRGTAGHHFRARARL